MQLHPYIELGITVCTKGKIMSELYLPYLGRIVQREGNLMGFIVLTSSLQGCHIKPLSFLTDGLFIL